MSGRGDLSEFMPASDIGGFRLHQPPSSSCSWWRWRRWGADRCQEPIGRCVLLFGLCVLVVSAWPEGVMAIHTFLMVVLVTAHPTCQGQRAHQAAQQALLYAPQLFSACVYTTSTKSSALAPCIHSEMNNTCGRFRECAERYRSSVLPHISRVNVLTFQISTVPKCAEHPELLWRGGAASRWEGGEGVTIGVQK